MLYLIALSLFIIALLYSSVGHGGASGYIAVFSLFNIAVAEYKPLVLLLNILISGFAFIQFYRAGYAKWKIILPFLITSIPFAFIGSKFVLNPSVYHFLLGIALLFPIIRLLNIVPSDNEKKIEVKILPAIIIGALLGFISGLLNIGGGIFLSPVLILLSWASAKESAAASALFIFCNSIAGMLSINNYSFFQNDNAVYWLLAAASGGIIGSYLGSNTYKQATVRYVLATVMSIASVKLLFF